MKLLDFVIHKQGESENIMLGSVEWFRININMYIYIYIYVQVDT